MAESQKESTKGGSRPTTPLLDLPIEQRASSRNTSPARLSVELALKVRTQFGRFASVKRVVDTLPASHEETSLEELNQILMTLEETHKAFVKEHAYFEVSWPAALINHEYFENGTHTEESQYYAAARRNIGRLRTPLVAAAAFAVIPAILSPTVRRERSRLPDISIPTFKGDYTAWPAFRDLFKSLVLDDEQLTDVERLHYLRVSLEGSPAQLISGLPMAGDSLTPSWDMLTNRYDNKRLLIQSYIDQLFGNSTPVQRKAATLDKLLTEIKESLKALQTLGVTENMWDCFIVYQVTRRLDKLTREQWETSLGPMREYPRLERLEEFLASKAQTLERIENAPAQPSTSSSTAPVKKATAQLAAQRTTQPDSSTSSIAYPCDCCNGQHYVVTCAKFRELTPADRHKIAVSKRLCFNCLGRHNARSCKSTRGCKKCTERHHTMLHEAHPTPSTQPSAGSSSYAEH